MKYVLRRQHGLDVVLFGAFFLRDLEQRTEQDGVRSPAGGFIDGRFRDEVVQHPLLQERQQEVRERRTAVQPELDGALVLAVENIVGRGNDAADRVEDQAVRPPLAGPHPERLEDGEEQDAEEVPLPVLPRRQVEMREREVHPADGRLDRPAAEVLLDEAMFERGAAQNVGDARMLQGLLEEGPVRDIVLHRAIPPAGGERLASFRHYTTRPEAGQRICATCVPRRQALG